MMKELFEKRKLNKVALLIACVHFLLSFFTDRWMFHYLLLDFSDGKNALRTLEAWGVKAVFFLLLIVLWQGVFLYFGQANKVFRKYSACYFILLLLLLLLTWPGIWRNDEFGLLTSASQLFPLFWQNYLSSVFYILALMLLPFPAGVIIVQCLCISLIVGRILSGLHEMSGQKTACIAAVAFVLPPVLDSNLYPIRMSLYAFLELWLVCELFFYYEAKRQEAEADAEAKELGWHILLLAAVVTVWRTEAIYYVLLFPVMLLFLLPKKARFKPILLYLAAFAVLFLPQKVGERFTDGQQYELTSIVLPLVPLVQQAAADGEDALLAQMDPIINTDVILSEAAQGKTGIQMFWTHPELREKKADADFAQFKQAYHRLIIKYPIVFLKERFHTFLISNDVLDNTALLYVQTDNASYQSFRAYPLSRPLSDKLRTNVIKILELKKGIYGEDKTIVTNVIYSAIPSILILLAAVVILLCKKKWTQLWMLLLPLAKVPLIFLTAPSRLFMYYYSIYLAGYFLLFWRLSQTGHGRKV